MRRILLVYFLIINEINEFELFICNSFFDLNNRQLILYKNKKSGNLTQNEMDSALVGNEGLELSH